MTIELGTTDINKVYLGSTEINKIALGGTDIYDKTSGGAGPALPTWTLANALYDSGADLVQASPIETAPRAIWFKEDGTQMLLAGNSWDVREFDLSLNPWDLDAISGGTGATPSSETDTSTHAGSVCGVWIGDSGTKMYVAANTQDAIVQYSLSVAYDPTSLSYVRSLDVSAQSTFPTGVFFKADGTQLYCVDGTEDRVHQWTMSTAWDLSAAVYQGFYDVTAQDTIPRGVFFKADGTQALVVGTGNDTVYLYNLSTAWDVTSMSYTNESLSIGAQGGGPNGIFVRPDASKFYIVGQNNDRVYQYTFLT